MENKLKVWLARDKDGELYAYSKRPNKLINYWWFGIGLDSFKLDCTKFPSVKWEDDEPTEAYITLAEPQEQPNQEQPQPKQEIDWEQRQYEIAKEMLPVIYRQEIAVSYRGEGIMLKDVADIAVAFADTLISTLKNKTK